MRFFGSRVNSTAETANAAWFEAEVVTYGSGKLAVAGDHVETLRLRSWVLFVNRRMGDPAVERSAR
jgi:hypothetical protein